MQLRTLVLAAFAATSALPAHAIHVNQQAFVANGGDLQDIEGSAPRVFDTLRVASFAGQFGAVGDLSGCAGTWLGADATHAWILTAAHCVPTTTLSRPVGHLTFRDAHDRPLAGGAGSLAFVHPNRLQRPAGVTDAGTDIALLRMPLMPPPVNGSAPVAPWIHDVAVVTGSTVAFVGTGTAGVASTPVDAFWPTAGQRRVWGESQLDSTRENGHVGIAGFAPTQSATHWARAGVGDGGASWWQLQHGQWSMVAITNGGHSTSTSATLALPYAQWINDLFPATQLTTERLRVTNTQEFVSHNYAHDLTQGEVRFVVAPNQPGVEGPTQMHVTVETRHTELSVPVRDVWGNELVARLRAHRMIGPCGATHMDNPNACADGKRHGVLKVWYDPSDNTHLWNHQWKGKLALDAKTWGGSSPDRRVDLNVDIDLTQYKGRVTRTGMYESANLLSHLYLRSENLYFTVDPQPRASGPTSVGNNYYNDYVGHSIILVDTRSAMTQATVPIKLRAQRLVQCYQWGKMNYSTECGLYYHPDGRLRVWFDPADNPGLPVDRYLGEVIVRYHGPHASGLIRLDVEIDTLF